MQLDVMMPQLGESVIEGTIIKWHTEIGQTIEKDDILLEISTDKVDTEIPSPHSGKIIELLAKEGDTVQIGSVIAKLESNQAGVVDVQPTDGKPQKQVEPGIHPETLMDETKEIVEIDKPGVRVSGRFLSPLVRSIARREQIPINVLETLPGTGKDGRLRKEDILQYLEQRKTGVISEKEWVSEPATQPAFKFDGDVKRVPMDHIRKSIAIHMVSSVRTSPHVTSIHEVDVTSIMAYIDKNQNSFKQREGVKLTVTAFVAQASARSLKEMPVVNASIDGTDIIYHKNINLGVAVALENGLIVPVVRNADQLSLSGLAKSIYDLATRARTKKLKPDEVHGGTFSITNFGVFDTIIAAPIINQPQVAILGIGSAKQRVVAVDGMITIRWMMYLALTYDHRLLDGAKGGQFLQRMTQILENVDD